MNWRAMAVLTVGGFVLLVLAMFYSGMFMHGD
jgi:hypothetical protein